MPASASACAIAPACIHRGASIYARPAYSQRSFTHAGRFADQHAVRQQDRLRPRRALADLVAALLGESLRGAPRDDQHAAVGEEQHVLVRLQDRRVVAVAAGRGPLQPAVGRANRHELAAALVGHAVDHAVDEHRRRGVHGDVGCSSTAASVCHCARRLRRDRSRRACPAACPDTINDDAGPDRRDDVLVPVVRETESTTATRRSRR